MPSALTTVFALDPGASVLVPSAPLFAFDSLAGPAHYSGQLAVQWDLGARTLNFLPAGTALTALNSGTYKPDVNGGNSAAPGNYEGAFLISFYHGGMTSNFVAIRDLVATVSTASALPLTGTGSTYSFPSAQTLTIANGFSDNATYSGGFFCCWYPKGRSNLANQAQPNHGSGGLFQDLGSGMYRVTMPVLIFFPALNSPHGSATLGGTIVASATLPVVALGTGTPDYSTQVIATQGPGPITAPTATLTDANPAANLTAMTVTLTNHPDGAQEKLAANLSGTGLSGSYNAATGVETITGTAAPAVYQNVLRTLTYQDDSATPNTQDRVIQVAVSDGTNTSVVRTSTVHVYALTNTLHVGFAATTTAGVPGSLTVTAAPTYTGTVHFGSSDPQASLPPNYTFTAADHGVHTVSATFKTAGSEALWVIDTVNPAINGAQSGIVVHPAAASSLVVAGFPSPVAAGSPGMVTVTAYDTYGNVASGYTGAVHVSSSDGRAVLPANYTFTAADHGVHRFTATLNSSGPQSLTITDTASGSLTGVQTGIVVLTNPATLVVTGFPSPIVAGTAGSVTVTARDRNGDLATGYTGTVHLSSSDGQAVLPANYTFTAADHGVHTFSVALRTAGTQSLTAGDTGSGALSSTQTGIIVHPAAISRLGVTGFPLPVAAGSPGLVTVTSQDAYGNVVTGYTGTVHFSSSDSRAVLPANYTFTAADQGVHTFTATFNSSGPQSLTATDTASGSVTGTQTGIFVLTNAAALVVAGFPSPAVAGAAGSITVTARDRNGDVATGYIGTGHFSSSDALAVLPANYTFTATDHGVHTFSVTLKTIGTQSVTVADVANAALTATQSGIVVRPASLLVAGFPSPVTAGVAGAVTVSVRDAAGNIAPGYTGTVHLTSSDPFAALPADYTFTAADQGVHTFAATLATAGQQSLTATDAANTALAATQAGIVVNPGPAAILYAPGFPFPVTAGLPFNLTLIVQDVFGNTVPNYTGTLHFDSTDNRAVLPADYTFTPADHGQHTFSLTLKTLGGQLVAVSDLANSALNFFLGEQVVPGVASLGVSGFATPTTAGATGTITIRALDVNNQGIPDYLGTVHFTSSDGQASLPPNYTFTADDHGVHTFSVALRTAGTQALTATDTSTGAITGTQAGIVVNPAATATLVVAGFPVSIAAGTAGTVTVTAKDAYGNTAAYTGTVHFSSSDRQAVLPTDYTFSATDQGVHTFRVTLRTAGTQSLTATDTATGLRGTQSSIRVLVLAITSITRSAAVIDLGSPLALSGTFVPATAGQTHQVVVSWGDHSSDTTLSLAAGVFTFSTSHVYSQAGDFAIRVTLAAADGGSTTVILPATAAAVPPPAGLTGWWTGDATNALFAPDLAGNNPGTVSDGVTYAAGKVGQAFRFAGGSYVSVPDAPSLRPAQVSLEAWVQPLDAGVFETLVTKEPPSDSNQTGYGFRQRTNNHFWFTIGHAGFNIAVESRTVLVPGSWYHLVGTYDGATVKLYVNGMLEGTLIDGTYAINSTFPLVIGGFTGGLESFHGLINEVQVYNRVLSAGEVQAMANAGSAGQIKGVRVQALHLAITGFVSPTTAGAPGTFTLTVQDPAGQTVRDYRGTVHFTSSDPQALLPADYTFTAADGGVHTFRATLKSAGVQSLTVQDKAIAAISGMQSNIVVNPATAAVLLLAGLPSPRTAGTADSVTVTLQDAYGNIAVSYTGAVHFSSSDAQAVLPPNYSFTAADHGRHTFSVTLKTAGPQSLQVTDSGNTMLTATQSGIAVTPAAASVLLVTGFPASITAGVAGTVTVTAQDAYGNVATGYTGTVHLTSSDPQAVLPADYPFTTADHGVHTFSVTLKTAGTQSLTARDKVTAAISGSQSGILVNPAATRALLVTGFPTPVVAGTPGSMTVTAQDAYGNTTPAYTGTVRFSSSDTQAALPSDYGFTAADHGVHTFSATLKTAGSQALTAADRVTPTITGMQAGITVSPAAVHALVLIGVAASVVAGTPVSVTVAAQDAYGNTVSTYLGTVHFTSQDPYGALLPNDYTFTAADHGVHTFANGVTLFTAGPEDVTATDSAHGLTRSATVTVLAAAADHFLVTTSVDDSGTVAGTAFDVTITAQDAYGNTATDYSGTVTFASQDPYGAVLPDDYTFTPDDQGTVTFASGVTLFTAGSWDVTATDTSSGLSGTGYVLVTAAAADHFLILVPAQAASGTAFDVTVLALDPYDNVDTHYQGTIHFSSTDSDPGVILPDDYSFTADDQGMHTFAAGVTLLTAGDQTLTVADVDSGIAGSAVVTVTDAGGPSSARPGPGAASAASAAAEDSASQRPAIAPAPARPATASAVAIDAFFHQASRRRHPHAWMAEEFLL